MIQRLYPGGRKMAFNFSFDDGVTQDIRFVELLNRYGLKATFNLNSGLMKNGFEWVHESGLSVKRLPLDAICDIYKGHEIASHTLTHPMLEFLSEEQISREMRDDRLALEEILGRPVEGFAIPFTYHDDRIYECSKAVGFAYARISDSSYEFSIPEDPHRWTATMFHLEEGLEEMLEAFFETRQELALFQLIGHSYDLDVYDMWDRMERICRRLSQCPDIWSATHVQIFRYLEAMQKAQITDQYIVNRSDSPLWFLVDGKTCVIYPGEKENYQ